ncbi:hypothetical protein [Psychroserpens sp. MEBiC05023]
MTNSYSVLFDFQVTHTYFESGFSKNLVYSTSNETQQIIDRFGFKLVINEKGFQFYVPQEKSIVELLNYIIQTTGISYFEFNITTIDQTFYQYTNFPTDEVRSLVFDSSEGNSEDDFIVLKQQFLQDNSDNHLFKLRIYFADLLKLATDDFPVHYKIGFFSRATIWQYNIINNSQQRFEQLSIKGDANIEFDSGKDVILQNGQAATCFMSIGQGVLLSEIPKYSFDLVNTIERLGVKEEKTVFKNLPMPNPNQLQVIVENTQKLIISPMYVYI